MYKNKGFTLLELLGVVAILGIISFLAFPYATNLLKISKNNEYDRFLDDIYLATQAYLVDNSDNYPGVREVGGEEYISLKKIVESGYLKSTTVNPKTEKAIDLNSSVKVVLNDDRSYNFELTKSNYDTDAYVQDGLIVHYDGHKKPVLDNGVLLWKDLSSNNNDGIMNGFDPNNMNFWNGSSIAFDGVNDYIDMENKLINLFKNNTTIEFVIKFDDSAVRTVLLGNYNGNGNNSISLEKGPNSGLEGRIWYGEGAIDYITPNDFHILDTINNYSYKLDKLNNAFSFYQNSLSKYSTTNNQFANNYDFPNAKIGTDNRNVSRFYMKANVYSVRIYNRVLTDDEIKQNYDIDKVRFGL